jgi:hypothetical protein
MPTRSYEHLVGAYGVVGFSGVKDARKSVVRCRRSAEAHRILQEYRKDTERLQAEYKKDTSRLQKGRRETGIGGTGED